MLARASSDAGTRLRRSKSTSRTQRHRVLPQVLLDPNVAQQHALAAASAAFARVPGHDETDRRVKRSSEISRAKSNSSRKSLTSQGSHFPVRESSFRSLQPKKPGQAPGSHPQVRASVVNTEQFPPFCHTPCSEKPPSVARPLSSQPSIPLSENSRPSSQPNPYRPSASSSVTSQQIRKARSMYYASSVQTGSPIARPPAKYLITPPPTNTLPTRNTLPTPPPTRPLEPSPLAGPRLPVSLSADETIDEARDKYLQSFQHKTIKNKPSLFLAPFKKRQDKVKHNGKRDISQDISVSISSHRTPDESTADISLQDFIPHTGVKEKRSFSGSLRRKFKRVFRRTSHKSPNLPIQQIEASRDYHQVSELNADSVFEIPSPDEDTLRRARSRTPSLEACRPAFLTSGSRNNSIGSARSSRSDRSLHSELNPMHGSSTRVSSWGTSLMEDNLAQRAVKRLTVIHEAKDSLGSETDRIASMITVKRKPIPIPPLAAFRDPMPLESLTEESLTPVDPKRVFSALMREIGTSRPPPHPSPDSERTQGTESDVFDSSQTNEIHSYMNRDCRPSMGSDQRPMLQRPTSVAAQSAQSKTSTIRSLGRAIRSTIRAVTPVEQHSSPCPERSRSVRGVVRVPRDTPDPPSSLSTPKPGKKGIEDQPAKLSHSVPMEERELSRPSPCQTEIFTPSIAQIEKRVERDNHRWQTPLERIETLPYSREIDKSCHNLSRAETASSHKTSNCSRYHTNLSRVQGRDSNDRSNRDLVSTNSPASPGPRPVMSPLSPSIYSRNTDGISILPNDSVMSFSCPDKTEDTQDSGSAVILASQSVRSYVIGTPSPRRPDSTRTSRDWRAWLSHEISGMELTGGDDLRIHEPYMPMTEQHREEVIHTSHTENSNTTVILQSTVDMSTPRADAEPAIVTGDTPSRAISSQDEHQQFTSKQIDTVVERSDSDLDTFKEVSPGNTIASTTKTESPPTSAVSPVLDSTPLPTKQRLCFRSSRISLSSQPGLETPKTEKMNERFPFIDTGRRSSSNSARSSRKSKSPTDSLASSSKSLKAPKSTPSPTIYSDLSAPSMHENAHSVLKSSPKRSDAQHNQKENASPPYIKVSGNLKTPSLSRDSRRKSLQPLSSAALNCSTSDSQQHVRSTVDGKRLENDSRFGSISPTLRMRASFSILSPQKLYRRPRSAMAIDGANKTSPFTELRKYNVDDPRTPSPSLSSDSRCPAFKSQTALRPIAPRDEPSPGHDGQGIDGGLGGESRRSLTPGQRMADRFLRGRKSTAFFEGVKLRGGLKLAREDTPAFL